MKFAFLAGRVLFGGFFLYNGINHFRNRHSLAQYAGSKNVPIPDAAVAASGALLIGGGASLILGLKPKAGAAAIISFLSGVSPVMHDFWNMDDPDQRMNDTINFTKNMALLGSALALMAVEEPWPASLPMRESGFANQARIAEYEFDYDAERVPVPTF
jgi:putative oxidoreductase